MAEIKKGKGPEGQEFKMPDTERSKLETTGDEIVAPEVEHRIETPEASERRQQQIKNTKDEIEKANADQNNRQGYTIKNGKIILPPEQRLELEEVVSAFKLEVGFVAPALIRGNKTATEYDSKVANFSTRTKIVELADGSKYFVINNYSTSFIHRGLDSFMKRMTGTRMAKCKSRDWKDIFEERSRIPVLDIVEPNVVVLPFIPNVNAYDLFANREEIADFGECEYAKDIDENGLLDILKKITREVKRMHEADPPVTWGELILPNIIVDKEKQVHICDPETQYKKDVPLLEQKARDLFDFIMSSASAMANKNGVDHSKTIENILSEYGDIDVLGELARLAKEKTKLLHKLFFGYTKVRLGLSDKKEFEEIKKQIVEVVNNLSL
ncbi:MAG: hypothetical protein WC070_02125 [Candidatus Magasanikbacteria bacterium]